MATMNATIKLRSMHRLRVGLHACSRASSATDRAAAAHVRGDDRMAMFWLAVREHWRGLAARNAGPCRVRVNA